MFHRDSKKKIFHLELEAWTVCTYVYLLKTSLCMHKKKWQRQIVRCQVVTSWRTTTYTSREIYDVREIDGEGIYGKKLYLCLRCYTERWALATNFFSLFWWWRNTLRHNKYIFFGEREQITSASYFSPETFLWLFPFVFLKLEKPFFWEKSDKYNSGKNYSALVNPTVFFCL